MQGLQVGGLKPSKYRNVYAILRQRESDKADIIKVDAKWGLAEWNPELPPRSYLSRFGGLSEVGAARRNPERAKGESKNLRKKR